jgi:antitoxin component YwqK of YwqJK toxin-antitoxin module
MRKLLFLFLVLVASFGICQACSCIPPSPLSVKDFNETSVVFIGQVKQVKTLSNPDSYNQVEVLFEITQNFKGLSKVKEVKIYTASSSAACGITFQRGESWVLYANNFHGVLSTNLCTRSRRQSFAKKEDLAMLQSFAGQPQKRAWLTEGIKRGEGQLINGLAEGKWQYFYPNGQIEEEGYFINGKKNGNWIKYINVTQIEAFLKNNLLIPNDSIIRKEDFAHKISELTQYKNGKKNGEYVVYSKLTFRPLNIMNFIDDELNGIGIIYYPSGLIQSQGNYKKGELDGLVTGYHTNGQLMYEGRVAKGDAGNFKTYDETGKVVGTSVGVPYYDPKTKQFELGK